MHVDFSDHNLFNKGYIPFLRSRHPIEIYYGGSGSGKSEHIAQKQIIKCLSEKYYRLIFSRKTAEAIRDSQFRLFKDIIQRWGLESLFQVKESTMDIICTINGNMMLSYGLDKPENIKSVAEPTDIWLEEATEFTEEDFDQITLRIRTLRAKHLQIFLSFNPINEMHWIKKRFFEGKTDGVSILHTTFRDNRFLPPAYKDRLENLAKVNPNFYRIYFLGEWGKPEVKRPYMYNFNRDKHVNERAVFIPNMPIRFSFDFNLEPLICIASHIWKDSKGDHWHVFDEFRQENGDIDELLNHLAGNKDKGIVGKFTPYQTANAFFTGDETGRRRRVGGLAPWRIIQKRLNIPDKRIHLPSVNPIVSLNRFLCNAILANHPDMVINPKCRTLINEMQYTEADEDGNIIKANRSNDNQKADGLDCWRYKANVWVNHYV